VYEIPPTITTLHALSVFGSVSGVLSRDNVCGQR
jgi:hypothetical protein